MGKKIPYVRVSNLGILENPENLLEIQSSRAYFEAALYHSPQDIHKAWTTPRTASEDPFQTIQEPLLLECWRCFQSPWRHPETVKNSGSKQSKREPHTQKMESELDILSSPPEPVNILYDFVFFLYYLTRTPFHSSRLQLYPCMHKCFFWTPRWQLHHLMTWNWNYSDPTQPTLWLEPVTVLSI